MNTATAKATQLVLLIDDDQHYVKLLKSNLVQEGYKVLCGFDGGMAVHLAQRHHPDVILLDVNMPYIDGLKAFRALRSDKGTAHIPVVFISEMASQMIYPIVAAAPRAAHLKKPIDPVDLNSFLRHFLERYAA